VIGAFVGHTRKMHPFITSRRQLHAFTFLFAGFAVMGLIGTLVDFLPAGILMGKEMLVVSVSFSLLVSVVLIYLWFRSDLGKQVIGSGIWGWFKAGGSWAIMLPMIWFVCFMILGKGLPWAYTWISGCPARIEATLRTEHGWKRRHCDYRARGLIRNQESAVICISKEQYRAFPDQRVSAVLVGRESELGFAWGRVELMRLPPDRE